VLAQADQGETAEGQREELGEPVVVFSGRLRGPASNLGLVSRVVLVGWIEEEEPGELPSGEELARELERYLRERRRNGEGSAGGETPGGKD